MAWERAGVGTKPSALSASTRTPFAARTSTSALTRPCGAIYYSRYSTTVSVGIAAAGFNPLDATSLLAATGLLGIFLVMVAETGLLIGFFLPGDSLLFTAGLLAASRGAVHLPLAGVVVTGSLGAVVGAQIGFWIGGTLGVRLLARTKHQSLRRGAHRAAEFINRYGAAKAIVLARFIPIVRTVMNPIAGSLNVPARVFILWQVIGGLGWSVGVSLAGYWLGSRVPGVDRYLLPLVAVVVALSLVPIAIEIVRSRRKRTPPAQPHRLPSDCAGGSPNGAP